MAVNAAHHSNVEVILCPFWKGQGTSTLVQDFLKASPCEPMQCAKNKRMSENCLLVSNHFAKKGRRTPCSGYKLCMPLWLDDSEWPCSWILGLLKVKLWRVFLAVSNMWLMVQFKLDDAHPNLRPTVYLSQRENWAEAGPVDSEYHHGLQAVF